MNDNNQIVKSESSSLESWAAEFTNSVFCPAHLKGKIFDIVHQAQLGNELGITRMVAINNIYIINDRPTLSAALYKALALRGKVTWKILKSYEPIYNYLDTKGNLYEYETVKDDSDYKLFPFMYDKLPNGFNDNIAPKYKDKILLFKHSLPSDYVTEIEFVRNGMKVNQKFTLSEALTLPVYNTNPNYKNRPKSMFEARCFTNGIRNIAPDLVFGFYQKDD